MTITGEKMTSQVSNVCECVYCPDCLTGQYGTAGDACWNCGEPVAERDYCDADCWNAQAEDFAYVVNLWMEANNVENFYIQGHRMGWQKTGGRTEKISSASEALKLLTAEMSCTVSATYDPDDEALVAVRTSHDEMGAYFEFVACEVCWFCGDGIIYDEVECAWTDLGGFTHCGYGEDEKHGLER